MLVSLVVRMNTNVACTDAWTHTIDTSVHNSDVSWHDYTNKWMSNSMVAQLFVGLLLLIKGE